MSEHNMNAMNEMIKWKNKLEKEDGYLTQM